MAIFQVAKTWACLRLSSLTEHTAQTRKAMVEDEVALSSRRLEVIGQSLGIWQSVAYLKMGEGAVEI
jgi:hypothetical protein